MPDERARCDCSAQLFIRFRIWNCFEAKSFYSEISFAKSWSSQARMDRGLFIVYIVFEMFLKGQYLLLSSKNVSLLSCA